MGGGFCRGCMAPVTRNQDVSIPSEDSQGVALLVDNPKQNNMNEIHKQGISFNSSDGVRTIQNMKDENKNENEETIKVEGGLEIKVVKYKMINKKNEINLVLTGPKNMGKTTFVRKYMNKKFDKDYNPTIGIDKNNKKITIDSEEYKLNFIEPCLHDENQEHNHNDFKNIVNSNDFILLFYDISVKGSFDLTKHFFHKYISTSVKLYQDVNFFNLIFVGTKLDIVPREEPIDSIKNYCSRNNFDFQEISSKNNKGINELIKLIIQKYKQLISPPSS